MVGHAALGLGLDQDRTPSSAGVSQLRRALTAAGLIAAATLIVSATDRSAIGAAGTDATRLTYFIAEGDRRTGYVPSDRQLAEWAFADWAAHAAGALDWQPAAREADALVRLYWMPPSDQTFGEMRPLAVGGRTGAEVFVRADLDALGRDLATRARQDPLWRDAVVYLTCVHELGHALGLAHTADYRDIMYFFGFGGDIVEYFARYRRQIASRDDIARVSGLSDSDIGRLRRLHPAVSGH